MKVMGLKDIALSTALPSMSPTADGYRQLLSSLLLGQRPLDFCLASYRPSLVLVRRIERILTPSVPSSPRHEGFLDLVLPLFEGSVLPKAKDVVRGIQDLSSTLPW